MNEVQSVESGAGLLKNAYDAGDSPTTLALKKRKAKMADKIPVPDKDEVDGPEVT